jgi:tetratricopeptide (TPR) repeat protein
MGLLLGQGNLCDLVVIDQLCPADAGRPPTAARALIVQWDYGSVEDFAPFVRQAREAALQAVALDSENPQAQYVLAQISHWAGDIRAAIAHASRAIELNANFALGHFYPGIGLSLDGRHEGCVFSLPSA